MVEAPVPDRVSVFDPSGICGATATTSSRVMTDSHLVVRCVRRTQRGLHRVRRLCSFARCIVWLSFLVRTV